MTGTGPAGSQSGHGRRNPLVPAEFGIRTATGWRTSGPVHLAAIVVETSRSRPTSSPQRGVRGRRNARRSAEAGPRKDRRRFADGNRPTPRPRRARHVVFVMAMADLGVRRHQPPRKRGDQILPRSTTWSPGPTSCSSGSARMIIAGYEYRGEMPRSGNVYLTGIVRDKLRRKMSKIARQFARSARPDHRTVRRADGVRLSDATVSRRAGNDLLFDDALSRTGPQLRQTRYGTLTGW